MHICSSIQLLGFRVGLGLICSQA